MDSNIVYVKSYKDDEDVVDFLTKVHAHPELFSHFLVARFDAINVRKYFRDYMVENGISALFNFSLNCDAVTHGGIHVDEIVDIVLQFVDKLKGVKDLFIIDPYFYTDDPVCVSLFRRMSRHPAVRFAWQGSPSVSQPIPHDTLVANSVRKSRYADSDSLTLRGSCHVRTGSRLLSARSGRCTLKSRFEGFAKRALQAAMGNPHRA
ncbi:MULTISPECIES: hypothetical protein [unclassified Paraburkholderia]|uniref:hypothetical protein n=1 Tax=unclassified Paraburkholderia TaxID=2615204 RepID=UPI002AB25CE3|nr:MULTISPECIES: hypothetical protein [unclassified Paraburkholderia]